MAESDGEFLLHRLAFQGNVDELARELQSEPPVDKEVVNAPDKHGCTPLQIAVMKNQVECIKVLLDAGATIDRKAGRKYNSLAEAISVGDKDTIRLLLKRYGDRMEEAAKDKTTKFMAALTTAQDCYIELTWDVHSWVPLLSRVLPRDHMRIWKIGDKIRLDSTLLDVSEGAVSTKGQHTFIIAVNEDGGLVSTAVDHGDKSYVRKVVFDAAKDKEKEERSEEEKAEDLEHELNAMMASEIVEANLRPQDLVFTRALSGFPGWRSDRTDTVGEYQAAVFHIEGATFAKHIRREHLSKEDRENLKRRKREAEQELTGGKDGGGSGGGAAAIEAAAGGNGGGDDAGAAADGASGDGELAVDVETEAAAEAEAKAARKQARMPPVRESLPEPERAGIRWEEYIGSDAYIHLGRKMDEAVEKKSLKPKVWMTEDVPLKLESIVSLFSVLASTSKQIEKVRDFIEAKLPSGFPVKFDMPVFPTISFRVTFEKIELNPEASDTFIIPAEYEEVVDEADGGEEADGGGEADREEAEQAHRQASEADPAGVGAAGDGGADALSANTDA